MNTENPQAPAQDENQIIAERREKLAPCAPPASPSPTTSSAGTTPATCTAAHGEKSKEDLEAAPVQAQLAGRMMLKRVMGKASFATLQDMSGRVQIYVSEGSRGRDPYDAFKRMDLGDILGATGRTVPHQNQRTHHPVRCSGAPAHQVPAARCRRNSTASPIRSRNTASATWT
jgi:lysyl-tRNA synthetase class 2